MIFPLCLGLKCCSEPCREAQPLWSRIERKDRNNRSGAACKPKAEASVRLWSLEGYLAVKDDQRKVISHGFTSILFFKTKRKIERNLRDYKNINRTMHSSFNFFDLRGRYGGEFPR